MELTDHERQSLDASRRVGTLVSPRPSDLPRLPPWAAPNGWDYWGRPWVYLDAPSSHNEVGVSIALTPPFTRVNVAVLVDCPHEPQFLPDMVVTQSASVVAGRAMRQARPFTQKGEIQDKLKLEVAAKWLFPRGCGDSDSAVLDCSGSTEGLEDLSDTQYGAARESLYAYRGCYTTWMPPGSVSWPGTRNFLGVSSCDF